QVEQPLAEVSLLRRRGDEAIGEQVVVPVRPERAQVTQPAHLHRRRAQRKNLAFLVRGVAVQIEQHADAVAAYPPRELASRFAARVDPVLEAARDALAEG